MKITKNQLMEFGNNLYFPRFIIFVCIFLLIGLFFGCQKQPTEQNKSEKPNIIYIMADDLGYGDIGVYGQDKIETPNIDALAENGMIFTQHYSGSSVCAPSRYMLMTGKHSGNAYIRGNDEMRERFVQGDIWDYEAMYENPELEGQRPIPSETITVAEVLKEAGYQTGLFGKWGLGAPGTEGIPNKQGFDYFYGYICQRQAHTYYPTHLWRNTEREYLDNEFVDPYQNFPENADPHDPRSYARFHEQPDYSAELIGNEALHFIERNKDDPFFLYFASTIPHGSLQAPRRWIDYYHEKFGNEDPYTSGAYVPVQYPHATHAAMVSYLDEQVGEMIEKLKSLDLYENTLVIFTSDNGPELCCGMDPEFFKSAAPFGLPRTRTKGTFYEGGIRVPMIASWPGVVRPGSVTDHISAFWDIMPTFAELAGATPPPNIDGISMVPTLTGTGEQQEHEYLYWEFPSHSGEQAVRMNKWKGIRRDIKNGNMDIELYNLEKDIREEQNVADQYREVVESIRTIMAREHTKPEIELFRMDPLTEN